MTRSFCGLLTASLLFFYASWHGFPAAVGSAVLVMCWKEIEGRKNERWAMAKAEGTTGLVPSPPSGSIRRKHRGTEAPGMDSPVQQGRQISEQNNIRTCNKRQVYQAQISDKDLMLTSANVSIFHMMSIITPTVVIMKKSTVIHWSDNSANKTMQWS